MVAGEAERQVADEDTAARMTGAGGPPDAQDRRLGIVDDRRREAPAWLPDVADRERQAESISRLAERVRAASAT